MPIPSVRELGPLGWECLYRSPISHRTSPVSKSQDQRLAELYGWQLSGSTQRPAAINVNKWLYLQELYKEAKK